jgi:hypothetical protein
MFSADACSVSIRMPLKPATKHELHEFCQITGYKFLQYLHLPSDHLDLELFDAAVIEPP